MFLINVPIGVIVVLAGSRVLPRSRTETHVRLDLAGVALLTVAMTAITLQAGLMFTPYALGFGALSLSWNHYPQRLWRCLPIVGPLVFAAG